MQLGRRDSVLHGFLIIDKPAGWTSQNVVGRVRRLTGEKQVGHAGTLDPAATGVLPVAVGDATKVLEFLDSASKTYVGEVTFGISTDSEDADGRVTDMASVDHLTRELVKGAIEQFVGDQWQVPPRYSAIKVGGVPNYRRARGGEQFEVERRAIHLRAIELLDWQPPTAGFWVDCSKGTYVRSLARDIGGRLGVPAHLSNLVRMRHGPFSLCEAWTLTELQSLDLAALWSSIAIHPDRALETMEALILNADLSERWLRGLSIAGSASGTKPVRGYSDNGEWLGIGIGSDDGIWKPRKVIRTLNRTDR